jgi:hypothetical protein
VSKQDYILKKHVSKQDYILKKHVRADSAAEALALDAATPVHEVFIVADKPERLPEAVGFQIVQPED